MGGYVIKATLRQSLLAGLLLLTLLLAACAGEGTDEDAENKGDITVGVSGAFAEAQIVAEMYAQVLENAGYNVQRQLDIGARDVSQAALNNGEIDVVPEYLTSLLLFLDPDATPSSDATEAAAKVRDVLGEELALLEPSEANDTNAIVVTEETAEARDLEQVSDLAPIAGELTFGGPPECPERPLCEIGLRETYGITFQEFRPLDAGGPLTVAALDGGEIDVALLFSTSSVIEDRGFVVLEDDQNLQAADHITPLVREEVVNEELVGLLNGVSDALTTENITQMNSRVELDKEEPSDVAQEFLDAQGLI